jgi:peptide/nickel transport system permease protein
MGLYLITRRIVLGVPTIIVICTLVFVILLVLPGNPAALIQGQQANPAVTHALIVKWGLNQPVAVRFGHWALSVLHLNLGVSLTTGLPVTSMIWSRLPYTLLLALVGTLLGLAIGVPAGIVSARRPGSAMDTTLTLGALVGVTVPPFVLALLLQLVAFYTHLFPISGAAGNVWSFSNLDHVLLPALTLAAFQGGVTARVVRVSMLDVLQQDYVRTARSKGLADRTVINFHALPNVLIPLVTLIGFYLQMSIAGVLMIEIVFSWPGIGQLFYDAVLERDYPVIQGVALLIAIGVYVVNLAVDILYCYIDPRVRVEGANR